ncbi:DUF4177 domain-containing protein [Romboutsia weinsteinii]|uniref:DUF4177 domain-containing protein n=1 Tax=Romboutsia weinsteinii TaxID=2020949 RepID=A0A371J0S5_9FIRM|nr:DUF4177 domain-containing protein [Romboutsia weinsteinii]RDY26268.1 DUF4177 domain-containing protein [Romboutsia weinsteinii]
MYEYKFMEVPLKKGFKVKPGDTFEECKSIIHREAKNGWRLKQVIIPTNENKGLSVPYCYQIIFEKEIN